MSLLLNKSIFDLTEEVREFVPYEREREKKYFIKRETHKSRRVSKPLAKLDEDLMLH